MRNRRKISIILLMLFAMYVNGCDTVNVNINVNTDKPVYNNADNKTESHNGTALERIRSSGVLRVGTAGDYQPMSYLDPDTDTYVGFDAELAEDLAKSLGVK